MNTPQSIRTLRLRRGFTLVELMITIVIAVIIAGIAAPGMRNFILNSRINSTASELLRSIQTARSEAAKRQNTIVICMSDNAATADPEDATCTIDDPTGWIVFQDTNNDWERDSSEELIGLTTYDAEKVHLVIDNSKRLSFAGSGFSNLAGSTPETQTPSANIVICDDRGNTSASGQSSARALAVTGTGRARMMRTTADIDNSLSELDATCPP